MLTAILLYILSCPPNPGCSLPSFSEPLALEGTYSIPITAHCKGIRKGAAVFLYYTPQGDLWEYHEVPFTKCKKGCEIVDALQIRGSLIYDYGIIGPWTVSLEVDGVVVSETIFTLY